MQTTKVSALLCVKLQFLNIKIRAVSKRTIFIFVVIS